MNVVQLVELAVVKDVKYTLVRIQPFTLRYVRTKGDRFMKQLIKLFFGVVSGKYKIVEYTRSNKENSDSTTTMRYGFDVIG